jgi:hypothetical protein
VQPRALLLPACSLAHSFAAPVTDNAMMLQ